MCVCVCVCVWICIHTHTHTHTHIQRERDRDTDRHTHIYTIQCGRAGNNPSDTIRYRSLIISFHMAYGLNPKS